MDMATEPFRWKSTDVFNNIYLNFCAKSEDIKQNQVHIKDSYKYWGNFGYIYIVQHFKT